MLKNIFFICFLLCGIFTQAAQQDHDRVQQNTIKYKVFGRFDQSYENVLCVRTQESYNSTGEFLAWNICDGIEETRKGFPPDQQRKLAKEFDDKVQRVAPGFYGVTDFVTADFLRGVPLSTIPHSFVVMPCINDLLRMDFNRETLLINGLLRKFIPKHMAVVENMANKPKYVFFEIAWRLYFKFGDGENERESFRRSIESMRQTIKAIDAAKQTHFYAGLYLDKKIREDGQWKNFLSEPRDTILAFVGHPYDTLE